MDCPGCNAEHLYATFQRDDELELSELLDMDGAELCPKHRDMQADAIHDANTEVGRRLVAIGDGCNAWRN
jgi:hypothetical protein